MLKLRRWKVALVLMAASLLTACSEFQPSPPLHPSAVQTTPVVQVSNVVPNTFQVEKPFSLEEFKNESSLSPVDPDLKLVKSIETRFKKPVALVRSVIRSAEKYAYADFPTKNDILAIIAVESGFNTKAHYRGSSGLMQIENRSHRAKYKGRDIYDVDTNVQIGVAVLREYYELTNSKRGAVLAYNAGIGNYLKGRVRNVYYTKYKKELVWVNTLTSST